MPIPVYELIAVVGILLDNAVEEIENSNTQIRKIKFYAKEDEDKISISVINAGKYLDAENISKIFEEGYSSKGNGRGIGLSNVREKAKKYDFDIKVENKECEGENWISFEIILKKRS